MTVTPVPIRALLFDFYFGKRPILPVSLPEIDAVRAVFVVIPVVVVPMVAVVDPVVVFIVSMVLFLMSISSRPGCGIHCRGRGEACHQKKGT